MSKIASSMYLYVWNPATSVKVNVRSSNTSEGTVSPATLTFTNANWNTPQTVTVTGKNDSDSDGNQKYNINLNVDLDVTTIAGTGSGGSANGQGTSASFYWPIGLNVDLAGNIFVADQSNNRIRRIDTQGNVITLAGTGSQGHADGSAASATFKSPRGVFSDRSGNVYVSDSDNHLIRKIEINPTSEGGSGLSAHIVTSGTCEAAGYSTVTSAAGCLAAGALTSPQINGGAAADQPANGYTNTGADRTKGCTVHNFNLNSGGNTQFFPNATGACGTASYNCICTESSDPEGVTTLAGIGSAGSNDGSMEPVQGEETHSFSGYVGTSYESYPSSYSKTNIGGSGSKLPLKLEVWGDFADQNWGNYCSWMYVYLTDADGQNISYHGWRAPRPRNTNYYTQKDFSQYGGESWYRPYSGFKLRMTAHSSGCAAYTRSMTVKLTYMESNMASFNTPTGITGDIYGNLYIADRYGHKIRKIDREGNVTTFAGSGTAGSTNGASSVSYTHLTLPTKA